MFNEIVSKYERFSDALISEILYVTSDSSRRVEVVVDCMNSANDYEFEKIKLVFEELVSIRFVENENESSVFINSAFLANANGVIVMDFFPLIYGADDFRENENSDFKIRCKKVSYFKID